MGVIIARNMLSRLELLINHYFCIQLVFVSFRSFMKFGAEVTNSRLITVVAKMVLLSRTLRLKDQTLFSMNYMERAFLNVYHSEKMIGSYVKKTETFDICLTVHH